MSMMIKVTPNELREAARQFLKAAEDLQTQLNIVKQQVQSLNPEGQDEAATRFKMSMPAHEQKVVKAVPTYPATAARLNEAATQYEAMEKAAAGKIRA